MIRRNIIGRWLVASSTLLFLAGFFSFGIATAADTNGAVSQSVAQSYGTDSVLQKGMLVKLKDGDSSKVVALSQTDASQMQGVIIMASDTTVTLSANDSKYSQVFVTPSGRYPVLVSNQNGAIKSGDYLAVSSLDGVAMKADESQAIIVGKAISDFNGIANVESTANLTNVNGSKIGVSIGRVGADIAISHNPLQQSSSSLPGVLQRVSRGVADKPVSIERVYLGLAVLLVSAFIAGSLLYSGVRASLVAIGRNPLAKRSIIRAMLQATLTSLIVFIIGLFAVYLVLKL